MRPISAKTSSGSAALFNTLRSFPAICARSQRERTAADVEEVGDNVSTKLQDLVDSDSKRLGVLGPLETRLSIL
jgi:hypothetical protein